jgi:sensor histidine kinase regulating citrate/malate metabolism
VNVILSSCIKRAENEHIEVISEVHIPENIKIDNMEVGSIFSNAMENAIIACEKIENPMNREISVVCKEYYSQIYIQISNPFVGEIVFDGDYPVSDNSGHGFGTRSIAAIAEKHGGVFSFTAQNGIFKTTVVLNNSH